MLILLLCIYIYLYVVNHQQHFINNISSTAICIYILFIAVNIIPFYEAMSLIKSHANEFLVQRSILKRYFIMS